MAGIVLLSIKLTARLAGVTVPAVRAAIRRSRLDAVTLAQAERTAVRFVNLREAARYYGWPPALVNRLEDEMRAGVPEGQVVYKLDTEPDKPGGAGNSDPDAKSTLPTANNAASSDLGRTVPVDKRKPAGTAASATQAEDAARGSGLAPDPTSARDAWERAAKELSSAGQIPSDPPPGFRLILPREGATLRRREVYDLVVDGEVVGTIPEQGFATYVREKCSLGEVFVNGKGAVKWRPRVPLRAKA